MNSIDRYIFFLTPGRVAHHLGWSLFAILFIQCSGGQLSHPEPGFVELPEVERKIYHPGWYRVDDPQTISELERRAGESDPTGKLEHRSNAPAIRFVLLKEDPQKVEHYNTNIVMTVEDLSSVPFNVTLPIYLKNVKTSLARYFAGYRPIGREEYRMSGNLPMALFAFRRSQHSGSRMVDVASITLMIKKQNKIYILSGNIPEAHFDRDRLEVLEILESIQPL